MKFYVEHLESSIGVWIEKPVENMENLIETLNNLAEEIIGEADVNSIRVTKIEGCQNPEKLFNEGGMIRKK